MDGAHGAVEGEVSGCGFYCVMVSKLCMYALICNQMGQVPHNPTEP